ncbi:MAG: hypothetical protein P1V97_15200 [Planctomycetota bacterium]|nr:hypothetical protein [Planctomycetota bacterium]
MKTKNVQKNKHRARQLLRWDQALIGRTIMLARRLKANRALKGSIPRESQLIAPLIDWIRPRSRAPVLT